ncbi:MAG: xanthine dehydrogenase family protein [Acidobacteria bacterium]|nr:xanthine dehydrogenase family protein [Acidobacteriota bacterium]
MAQSPIGSPVLRREGGAKLAGATQYTDDLRIPGLLHGVTVRSPVARGRLRAVHFGEGIPWEEFTIVRAADIPGRNAVAHILEDQPCLVDGEIRHAEEAVLLLAHEDRALAELARTRVRLDFEALPAVLSLDEALETRERVWGEDNTFKRILIEKGDPFDWAAAPRVHEGTYRTGAQEHVYIEPNAMIAEASPDGVLARGSLQCPYYVHHSLQALLGLPPERIRVVQLDTGGGFGGKEDFPSMIAAHAALLSWKAGGRPVKIAYDREEDMACTTKRHPSRTRIRSAFAPDGTLLALEIEFILDGGAYLTLSPVVLSRGALHASGPYRCGHIRIEARAVATNTPPHGAFRGFGAPQSLFAIERHMTEAARRLGMDPAELRRKNLLRPGDTMATGQVLRDAVDLPALMDRALAEIGYREKRPLDARLHERPGRPRRGIGFAVFMHGGGFTGGGEVFLGSVAAVEGTVEGRFRVLAASTEIGQGATTVFGQIAAEALGCPLEAVEVARPDTAVVPNSGPTVASRTTQVVGKLIFDAALALRKTLLESGHLAEGGDVSAAARAFIAARGALRAESRYQKPPFVQWDDAAYRGDAYATYAWACYAAEVSADSRTYEVRVEDFVAVQEVGRVVNPTLAAGQIEGGVAQGIGWALSEEVVWRDGRMANAQMTNYLIPTSADLPRIRAFFEESPYPYGPGGAKGIGELPMDGPAPAILNAVQEALGVEARELPLTPERLLDLVEPEAADG